MASRLPFARLLCFAVATLLVAAGPVWAAGRDGPRWLKEAEEFYQRSEFDAAAGAYEKALEAGELSKEQLVRTYAGIALTTAVLLNPERAVWAFQRLLAIDKAWALPSGLGPKVRAPFQQAKALWVAEVPPSLEVTIPPAIDAEKDVEILASAHGALLELVSGIRLRWRSSPETGQLSSLGTAAVFNVPRASLNPPTVSFELEAVDAHGSVVLSAGPLDVAVRALPEAAAPTPGGPGARVRQGGQTADEVPVDVSAVRLPMFRLYATVLGQVLSRKLGGEIGASYALARRLDVGLGVSLGKNIGGQVLVSLHPVSDGTRGEIRPFAQLRGVLLPLVQGLAVGGGAWLGFSVGIGPGRVLAGAAVEGYFAPLPYNPVSVLALAGYEVDLL